MEIINIGDDDIIKTGNELIKGWNFKNKVFLNEVKKIPLTLVKTDYPIYIDNYLESKTSGSKRILLMPTLNWSKEKTKIIF